MHLITPAQCRAARALLDWGQPDLASRCGTHVQTISNFEKESGSPTKTTLKKIASPLEAAGIEFIQEDGVRLKPHGVRTYKGREDFWVFYEDIYTTVKQKPGEVLVSNTNERDFVEWLGDNRFVHLERMAKLEGLSYKILIKDGDAYTPVRDYADYTEYRWMPEELFSSVPFYIYGDKIAFLLFGDDVHVTVIESKPVSEAHRKHFSSLWDISKSISSAREI